MWRSQSGHHTNSSENASENAVEGTGSEKEAEDSPDDSAADKNATSTKRLRSPLEPHPSPSSIPVCTEREGGREGCSYQ